jgi:hypothetical protein
MSRGVLMTTSRFTRAAEAYVRGTPKPIARIDGAELARSWLRSFWQCSWQPVLDTPFSAEGTPRTGGTVRQRF